MSSSARDPEAGPASGHASLWPFARPEVFGAEELDAMWAAALARRGRPGSPRRMCVYVNVPFCAPPCRYCMYWRRPARDGVPAAYVDGLVREIRRRHPGGAPLAVDHAYWGGGTPSLLSAAQIDELGAAFTAAFRVAGEFTVEANAESLDEAKLAALRRAGVKRLSLGVQSLDPGVLAAIGRRAAPPAVLAARIAAGRAMGLVVNADLVAGLPGSSVETHRADIDALLAMGPTTVFVYRFQPVAGLAGPEVAAQMAIHGPRPGWRVEPGGFRAVYSAARVSLGYSFFDDATGHLLGVGAGAYSHIVGAAWFRDVGAARPVYVGTRLSPVDECRSLTLAALWRGAWTSPGKLRRLTGVDPRAAFPELFTVGARDGSLRRRLGWFAPSPQASPAALAALRATILSAPTSRPLVLPPGVRDDDIEEALFPRDQAAGDAAAVEAWAACVGLAAGDELGGGRLAALGELVTIEASGRRLSLRVLGDPAAPAYGRSRRFALQYLGATPPSPPLAAVLDELVRRTRERDPL